ncbi:WD40 repeat domain-containing protein [Gordonia crocea]|uniref:Uncharacterized protein n=1 Tax=Gordonia crocea TaxID=589162 RepID=A0A7I9V1C2_9ACTN|nr:WD40 repeat domain-containing protein [Gordonia crocea]GED98951.1 hypothetical protein nbrc107697_29900 [Gordonia crocea]
MTADALTSNVESIQEHLESKPVRLPLGIGGGGRTFVHWLAESLDLGPLTDAGEGRWTFPGGAIVDRSSRPADDGPAGVIVEPDRAAGIPPHDIGPAGAAHLATTFLAAHLAGDTATAQRFVERFGPLTSVADSHGWASIIGNPTASIRQTEGAVRASDAFRDHFRSIQSRGGTRLLDLGRVLYLLAPQPMHLGDEWANLASAISNRAYTLADINLVLSECTDLFNIDSTADNPTVAAVNPFTRLLFSGFVPGSSSEYADLYTWMSRRSVRSLIRDDTGDEFIRTALPLVAARGNCLTALLEDGAVMLASDVELLADYLERDPELAVHPGAKAVLLHAHRLRSSGGDREAQMEFALRRMSLTSAADKIAEVLPERSWRPVWSNSSPANVHRVLAEGTAGVLSLAVIPGVSPFRAYAGTGNGQIHRVTRTHGELLDLGDETGSAEIRGLAAIEHDGADIIVVAASDATLAAYRVTPGPDATAVRLWCHDEPLSSPFTTATIALPADGPPVVLSGGVSGTVWVHDLLTGEDLGPLVSWGAEIRGVRTAHLDDRDVAIVVAVDSRLAVVDLHTHDELAVTTLAQWSADAGMAALLTPSCMNAIVMGDDVRIVVGCAMGELFEVRWSPGSPLDVDRLELPGVPDSGVNEVVLRLHRDGLSRFIARNDGVWIRYDPDQPRRIKVFVGHAGPVWAQAVIDVPGTGEVVSLTGGSEGTVRIWRHVEVIDEALAYLQVNHHRGAIRAIAVRASDEEVEVVTGGDDGDVRVWHGANARRGGVASRHQGAISAFLWLPTASGMRLVVGAADGSLRLATTDVPEQPARLLGIAHEGVTALAPSSTDGSFWSAGNDGGITRWDAIAGVARESRMVCRYGRVTAVATDGYGRVLVGGQDGSLSLVAPDGSHVMESRTFDSEVTAIDVVAELHLAVIGLASGHVYTLPIAHGVDGPIRSMHRHGLNVVAVNAFELYGQLAVVSVGRDRKVMVGDVSSRVLLHTISLEGFPTDLAVADNYIAVSTTAGGTLFQFADGHVQPAATPRDR